MKNIPVAILDSRLRRSRSGRQGWLTFRRTSEEVSAAFCNRGGEDVNADGLLDLVCHFDTRAAGFQAGDTEGRLKGKTPEGIPVGGRDSIRIVP